MKVFNFFFIVGIILFLMHYFAASDIGKKNDKYYGAYVMTPQWMRFIFLFPPKRGLPKDVLSLRALIGMTYGYYLIVSRILIEFINMDPILLYFILLILQIICAFLLIKYHRNHSYTIEENDE